MRNQESGHVMPPFALASPEFLLGFHYVGTID